MEVLCVIAEQVRKRRLMMYPYFKDYDRVRLPLLFHCGTLEESLRNTGLDFAFRAEPTVE